VKREIPFLLTPDHTVYGRGRITIMERGKTSTQLSNQEILQRVSSFLNKLNQEGVIYFLVGSLARRAYMGTLEEESPITPEIDLIIPDSLDRKKIESLQPPPGIQLDPTLSKFVCREGDEYFLKFGTLKIPVERDVFEPQRIQINGSDVFTLKPETLLHTYALVGNTFRPKDWVNAITFARWMKKKGIIYDHTLYLPFHEFNKKQLKIPLRKVKLFWRKILSSLPPEVLRNLKKAYNIPPIRTAIDLLNTLEEITCR